MFIGCLMRKYSLGNLVTTGKMEGKGARGSQRKKIQKSFSMTWTSKTNSAVTDNNSSDRHTFILNTKMGIVNCVNQVYSLRHESPCHISKTAPLAKTALHYHSDEKILFQMYMLFLTISPNISRLH